MNENNELLKPGGQMKSEKLHLDCVCTGYVRVYVCIPPHSNC